MGGKAKKEWTFYDHYTAGINEYLEIKDDGIDRYNEYMIKYGRDNYAQSYGGGTVFGLFYHYINGTKVPTSFVNYLPVYDSSGYLGRSYVYFRATDYVALTLGNVDFNGTLVFHVFVR